jgi:hypothetical protein
VYTSTDIFAVLCFGTIGIRGLKDGLSGDGDVDVSWGKLTSEEQKCGDRLWR